MNNYLGKHILIEFWECDKSALDNIKTGILYTLVPESKRKMLRFKLEHPFVNGKIDHDQLILDHTYLNDTFSFLEIDLIHGRRRQGFRVSNNYVNGSYITINDDNLIEFNVNQRFGIYDNGYSEDYELTVQEMKSMLSSSKIIKIFAEYYGKFYPNIITTLENAKSDQKGTGK